MKKLVCTMVAIMVILTGVGMLTNGSKANYYDKTLQKTADYIGAEYVGLYKGDGRDLTEWMAKACKADVEEINWKIIKDEGNTMVIQITVDRTEFIKDQYLMAWI